MTIINDNIQSNKQYQNEIQKVLPLMEQFYSIQGEGFHTGKASSFIRLAGCDVGCIWCDVKESWDAKAHSDKSVDEILEEAESLSSRIAIVTGGEPLMYNLNYLTDRLKKSGFQTHIETSGAYPLTGTWDWICLSPKKFKFPISEVIYKADELKIIIYNKSDFDWAEKYAQKVRKDCKLYLQLEWSRREQMMTQVIEYVKNNPKWQISLQTHKYMNIP